MKRHIFKPDWLCGQEKCQETTMSLVKEYQEYYDKLLKKYNRLKCKLKKIKED
jgi:hypothetical protein